MKKITLTLDVADVNLLFKALGRMPFEEVYELIGKINAQVNEQYSGNNLTPFNPSPESE